MARIKLQLPTQPLFETTIPVRITDINYGNHLGNDALVGLLHEARVLWLTSLRYTELDIEGVGIIMSDLAVEYKNEAFYGDNIFIKLFIGETTSVSFELYYALFNQHHKEIAKAKTGMVCFDYNSRKIAPLPAGFIAKLAL